MASLMTVEMGEIKAARPGDALLQACGLGACVGLCLYEVAARIAILVHVVLPQTLTVSPLASRQIALAPPGKCAETALPYALAEIAHMGGRREHVQAALVGGAHIFSLTGSDPGALSRLEIGARNVIALKEGLIRENIALCAEESGGHFGRTVTLNAATGDVLVRPVGLGEYALVRLGRAAFQSSERPIVREEVYAYGR